MRQIRTSGSMSGAGSMSGEWNRSMVGYSGTGTRKSRQHARPHLNHRATPRLYSFAGYSEQDLFVRSLLIWVLALHRVQFWANRQPGFAIDAPHQRESESSLVGRRRVWTVERNRASSRADRHADE